MNWLVKTLKLSLVLKLFYSQLYMNGIERGRRGRDHMVVGSTTTCAVSACHNLSCEWRGVLDAILCDKVCQ